MLNKLDILSESEKNALNKSIPLIALLVAGSDGNIDLAESEWASKLNDIRSYTGDENLQLFYERVYIDFDDVFGNLIDTYPKDIQMREKKIVEELEKLNSILIKFDPDFGAAFYKSLVTYAKHIAKSSGGLFTFGSISHVERKWINLPMIKPIYH